MSNYRIFIGFDPRQPVAYNICQHSIVTNASKPVQITPLILSQLPIERRGLTEFTFTRFLVPWLCDYKGKGMFLDPDMIVTGDVCELIDSVDNAAASVHVVKDQPKFEWPSMMVFSNMRCKKLTPEYIDADDSEPFVLDEWANEVGELPSEWSNCLGYGDDKSDAKLLHWTMGLPFFPETDGLFPEDKLWHDEFNRALSSVSWTELMGPSIHAERVQKLRGMKSVENQ